MAAARVGIVVPAHNAGRFLASTLDSVRAQEMTDWACAIVDDGSTDDTAAVARRYVDRDPRFTLVRQGNGGVCRARTAGLDRLGPGTDRVVFLDADDVWLPHTLGRLLRGIDTPRDDGGLPLAVHALATFVDEDGRPIRSPTLDGRLRRLVLRGGQIIEVPPGEPTTADALSTWPCILTPGLVMVRRDAVERVGGWDDGLTIGEDWELWYRLSLLGPIAFIDEPLVRYRVHAASASSNWRRPFGLARARAKIMHASLSSPEQRRHARRAFRAMSRRLAHERLSTGYAAVTRGRLASGGRLILGGALNLAMSVKPL